MLLTLAVTGGISPQKALVISLPLDGVSCSGLHTRINTQRDGGREKEREKMTHGWTLVCSRLQWKAREVLLPKLGLTVGVRLVHSIF